MFYQLNFTDLCRIKRGINVQDFMITQRKRR